MRGLALLPTAAMDSIIHTLLLITVSRAQWSIPGVNSDSEPVLGGSLGQAQGPFGGFYSGSGLSSSSNAQTQGANPFAADLAPQFAQFGSQYGINSLSSYGSQNFPSYGTQSIPMDPTSLLAGSRGAYDIHPLLLPSQTRPVRQFTHQPGAFGLQAPPQAPYGQFALGTSQPIPYSPFQADDFSGTVQKPLLKASLPPSSEPVRVIPPFLKGQSKEDQDKQISANLVWTDDRDGAQQSPVEMDPLFYAIVQHPTWSPSEKNAKIEELIASMNADVQNIYSQYQRASSGDITVKRQKVHEAVAAMSPEAQQQFQKVSALMTNPRIPEQERLQKIQDLYAKIPDSIKREFDSKFINL
ncbi:hypothetical protein ANCCAN_12189 [Ancylostoma caninum]|uniref:SXP/RAL-2 family protein Ani s 5-like cation-binding domain-containing protein n=1 Tax=Ancylostoma caninum TaxID=29170 RepID=A0A368GBW9_ANCCA|nr:hypothetical protein ANCCAN_12189 [Ancylostoma caninum]